MQQGQNNYPTVNEPLMKNLNQQNFPPPPFQQQQQQNMGYNQGFTQPQPQVHNYNAPPAAQVIVLSQGGGIMCPVCARQTQNINRSTYGAVTWIWCLVLLFLTGICCFIPFCVRSCQDSEVVCVRCQIVKTKIPANCC